jgi:hypothetical protein
MTLRQLARLVLLDSLALVQPIPLATTYNTRLQDGVIVYTSPLAIMRPQIQMLEYSVLPELGACTVMAIGVWQPKIRSASPALSVTTARPPIRLLKFANQENSKL